MYGGCVVVVMLALLFFFTHPLLPFPRFMCVSCEEEREDEILECHKDGAILKDSDLVEWDFFFLLKIFPLLDGFSFKEPTNPKNIEK